MPTCRSRASSAEQIQSQQGRRGSLQAVTEGRVRRDGGRSAEQRVIATSSEVRIDKSLREVQCKTWMAAISHVQPDALWRRRGFASVTVDITRNVAVTVFCSLLLAPCSPPLLDSSIIIIHALQNIAPFPFFLHRSGEDCRHLPLASLCLPGA
jgi:hypothetical protein